MAVEHLIEYNGKTQSISDWSAETGINRKTLSRRINDGWTLDDAFTIPANGDRAISIDDGDPQCLADLAISINASALQRVKQNMTSINAWIDEQCRNDPEKAARLLDKLSAIFDRFAKHTAKGQNAERAMVNISVNTESRPEIVIDSRGDVD